MAIVFRALHAASSPALLNEEYLVVENTSSAAISSSGWALSAARSRGSRPSVLGALSPGFTLQPGEKIRLVTGTPSKKAQGTPPAEGEGLRNYYLFLKDAVLVRPGVTVHLSMKNLELARATFDASATDGLLAG